MTEQVEDERAAHSPTRRELVGPVATMVAARLLTVAVVVLAGRSAGMTFEASIGVWDGEHYVRNAEQGYPRQGFIDGAYVGPTLAFYPLLSMAIRAVVWLSPLSPEQAGAVLALAFAVTTAAVLWAVFADWAGRETADRAITLLAFFPGAYVLSLIYAEGLMLTLAGVALLALGRRRWLLAGVAAALCTATRPNAIVLVACCVWAAVAAIRSEREWRSLAAPLLAPLGAVSFHLFLWNHTGTSSAWLDVQRNGWQERFDPLSLVRFVEYYVSLPLNDYQGITILLGTVLALVATVLLVKDRTPTPLLIWSLGVSLLVLTSSNLGTRPRFVMTAFPLFVPIARRVPAAAMPVLTGLLGLATGALTFMTVTTKFIVP